MFLNYKKNLFIALLFLPINNFATTFGGRGPLGHTGNNPANGLLISGRQKETFTLSMQNMQSFSSNHAGIGKLLFFNGTDSMNISYLPKAAGQNTDVYGYNFFVGLPYNSTFKIKPKITTVTTHFTLQSSLDMIAEGLYVSWNIPLVHTHWNIRLNEIVSNFQTQIAFEAGDINNARLGFFNGFASEYFTGTRTGGQINEPLAYGRLNENTKHSKIGDSVIKAGWNIINHDNCSVAIEGHALLNGNGATTSTTWFEPVVGTAGRHGLGIGFNTHQTCFERKTPTRSGKETTDYSIDFYADAQLTHLFSRTSKRSYDVTRHGVGSRYLLAKKKPALATAFTATDNLVPAINYTTLNAKINIDLLFNVTTMFQYTNGNFKLDLGYQLSGNTKENHKGWADNIEAVIGMKTISATNFGGADIDNVSTDIRIDGSNGALGAPNKVAFSTAAATITLADLNIASGLHPAEVSHHFFYNFEYAQKQDFISPFVGIGSGYEFGGTNNSLNQWHFFIQTGASF